MKQLAILLLGLLGGLSLWAQSPDYAKMSPLVRSIVLSLQGQGQRVASERGARDAWLCAFVEIEGAADSLLRAQGAISLAGAGAGGVGARHGSGSRYGYCGLFAPVLMG